MAVDKLQITIMFRQFDRVLKRCNTSIRKNVKSPHDYFQMDYDEKAKSIIIENCYCVNFTVFPNY